MNFHIVTLFPDSLSSYVNESIIGRAQKEGSIKIKFYNPRDFVKLPRGKVLAMRARPNFIPYKRVDDKPYGGGPGMVMQAEPMIKAIEKAVKDASRPIKDKIRKPRIKVIFLTPSGAQFTNEYARKAASTYDSVVIICGRYEGVDARAPKIFKAENISVGPYVLTGGELGAMIIIDAMSRQIEGVLGNFDSVEESRGGGMSDGGMSGSAVGIANSDVYTRPEVLIYKGKKYRVPKVLLSGDHAKIEEWKKGNSKSSAA